MEKILPGPFSAFIPGQEGLYETFLIKARLLLFCPYCISSWTNTARDLPRHGIQKSNGTVYGIRSTAATRLLLCLMADICACLNQGMLQRCREAGEKKENRTIPKPRHGVM